MRLATRQGPLHRRQHRLRGGRKRAHRCRRAAADPRRVRTAARLFRSGSGDGRARRRLAARSSPAQHRKGVPPRLWRSRRRDGASRRGLPQPLRLPRRLPRRHGAARDLGPVRAGRRPHRLVLDAGSLLPAQDAGAGAANADGAHPRHQAHGGRRLRREKRGLPAGDRRRRRRAAPARRSRSPTRARKSSIRIVAARCKSPSWKPGPPRTAKSSPSAPASSKTAALTAATVR